MGDEVDFMAHLETKRQDMAAMQEAANVAKAQAAALIRLHRRTAEIDALANGTACTPSSSSGSMPGPANHAVQALPSELEPSSLTAEDRIRFGLDEHEDESRGVAASLRQAEAQARDVDRNADAVISVNRHLQGLNLGTERREERRLDPDDRDIYCLEELRLKYEGIYDYDQAEEYFRRVCLAVPSRPMLPANVAGNADTDSATGAMPIISATDVALPGSEIEASGGRSREDAPRWSSLSTEDRRRFGLDEEHGGTGRKEAKRASPAPPPINAASNVQPVAFQHHPDVLWGADRTSPEDAESMARTIAQLEAVGATKLVADLKESERRLQSAKFRA